MEGSRVHKTCVLAKLRGVDTPEKATLLRGQTVSIDREGLSLPEGAVFIADLIGCRVFDADDAEKQYGVLTEVSRTGANDVWHVTDDGGREYLLPAIPPVVIDTDIDNERIVIRPLKGIFDDAD